MPFKAYAPGTRKGNRTYILRGRVAGGKPGGYEITSNLAAGASRKAIEAACANAERIVLAELEASRVPRPGESATFRRAAKLYIDAKDSRIEEIKRIDRLCAATGSDPQDQRPFGDYLLAEISHPVIVDIAKTMQPTAVAATRNRHVVGPIAAVLHYAADPNVKLCDYVKVQKFKEPRPRTRTIELDTAQLLIDAAPEGPKRLLLLWLFRQGTRISNTLQGARWGKIDLRRQTITMDIFKTDEPDVEKALHPEIFEALAAIPEDERGHRHRGVGRNLTFTGEHDDYVFPWHNSHGVYAWLRPMCRQLGVAFTPHMARHTLATEMTRQGVPIKTVGRALDQRDVRSTMRYADADVEMVRAGLATTYRPLAKASK